MTSYAAFDSSTEDHLRSDYDDTYVRPLVSFILDDPAEENWHLTCPVCQDGWGGGSRWVPDNGGAWVMSASWKEADNDYDKYLEIVGNYML
jgi:hypothetical protein